MAETEMLFPTNLGNYAVQYLSVILEGGEYCPVKNNFDKLFGDKIKSLRLEKGLSQYAVGKTLGYSAHQISNLELGKCSVTVEQIIQFSCYYDVPILSFFVQAGLFQGQNASLHQYIEKLSQLSKRDVRLVYGLIDQMLSETLDE